MTPEERVAPIWERWVEHETIGREQIIAVIRAAENDALERVASYFEAMDMLEVAHDIRTMTPRE